MPIGLGVALGIGGGKPATSGGAPPAGDAFANTLSCAFDATTERLNLVSDETFSGVFSLSLWFKPTDRKNFQTLVWGTGNDYIQLYGPDFSAGRYAITRGYATINSGSGVYDFDAWNHLLLVRDSADDVEVWINTSSIGSASKSGDVVMTSLGLYGTASADTFGGLLDEIAIWGSDQSSNLSTIYNSRVPADLTDLGPLSWWRMGETNPDSAGTAVALITDVQGRNNFAQGDASKQPVLSTDVAS
jgi:hypothetical protein